MLHQTGTMKTVEKARQINSTTLFLLVLGMVTFLTRLPFLSPGIESFDAINYILALSNFDIRLHQPQPPGYPLYILTGRFFNLFVQEEHTALLLVSAVFSSLAVVVVYLLARDMFGHFAGQLSALILGTSSFFWFTSEIAAPYAMDLFFSAFTAWRCYRALKTDGNTPAWIAALALGLAGAFRVQTMVFMFPLFLYSIRKRPWYIFIGSSAFAVGVFAAFFIPAVMASGGFHRFWYLITGIVPVVSSADTFVNSNPLRYIYNIFVILEYTFTVVGELAWPFIGVGCWVLLHQPRRARTENLLFIGCWLLPIWLVYFLIWAGNKGTALVSITPFFIFAGAGIGWLIQKKGWKAPGLAMLAVLVIWQIVSFAILPEYALGKNYRKFDNWNTIQNKVNSYQAKLNLISRYPAEESVVYAVEFRHVQYKLPQYHTFSIPVFDPDKPQRVLSVISIEQGKLDYWSDVDASRLIPPGTRYLIFFDLPLEEIKTSALEIKTIEQGEASIHVVEVPTGKMLYWNTSDLSIRQPAP